jgi:hypothetical protein
VPAVQVEVLDEVMREVQRAHWFGTTLELDEAARLAALLDIAPEAWHGLATFRGWVQALRDAMLREGAVTRRALQLFVAEYATAFQGATGVQVVAAPAALSDPEQWRSEPLPTSPLWWRTRCGGCSSRRRTQPRALHAIHPRIDQRGIDR